ncbi:MAG TPA: phytanoyl-CoA dioxygenase family protein [Caulobacteraceae bacterium]
MEIGDWTTSAELNRVYRDARDLGLETNLAELEAFGFTIIPPQKVSEDALVSRMLSATIDLCEEMDRAGAGLSTPLGSECDYARILYALISRAEVFGEAVMHPLALTLGRYLTGASCRLFTTAGFVKKGKATSTQLHTDTAGTPPPLYPYGLVCNISWLLTDYTEENGTFAIVPGSHRYCRHPTATEQPKVMGGSAADNCIPIIAPRGSIVAFNGNTWHGTYPKKNDALRAHFAIAYCRNYMMQGERFDDVFPAHLEAYGDELAHLLGRDTWQGYDAAGPRSSALQSIWRSNFSPGA